MAFVDLPNPPRDREQMEQPTIRNGVIPFKRPADTPSRHRIALADPAPDSATLMQQALDPAEHELRVVQSGRELTVLLHEGWPDVAVLDLTLQDVSGLVLIGQIRSKYEVPVVVWSESRRRDDPALARMLGADDYVDKSADSHELLARITAILRRTQSPTRTDAENGAHDRSLKVGALAINPRYRHVTLGGTTIPVTPTEFRLLATLASRPGATFSRGEIAVRVWGSADTGLSRTIDTHVGRLRQKLAQGPGPRPSIHAVPGYGYRIIAEDTARSLHV
jgi:DNA-binding response OmpR family regulator